MNAVIAGNYRQAEAFARQQGWRRHEWRYVHSDASMWRVAGLGGMAFHWVGTWWELADAWPIVDLARSFGIKVPK